MSGESFGSASERAEDDMNMLASKGGCEARRGDREGASRGNAEGNGGNELADGGPGVSGPEWGGFEVTAVASKCGGGKGAVSTR